MCTNLFYSKRHIWVKMSKKILKCKPFLSYLRCVSEAVNKNTDNPFSIIYQQSSLPESFTSLSSFISEKISCDNAARGSTLEGGGLRRVSTSVMEQSAIVIHSCNIFDHSKDFLAFFTSTTLLINVSWSKCKYRCRNSQLQLLRLIPTISIKFSKHHFLDSYWPPC